MSLELFRYGLEDLPGRRARKRVTDVQTTGDVRRLAIDRKTEHGVARTKGVARVGVAALEAQAFLTMTERMLVEAEPGAIHGIAYLSKKLTIKLGNAIDSELD